MPRKAPIASTSFFSSSPIGSSEPVKLDNTTSSVTTTEIDNESFHDFGVGEKNTAASSLIEEVSVAGPKRSLSPLSILKFITPTLALWIAPPVMSLIDTSVVGSYCGATDLAALGPGCTLIDSSAYLFMFIATAATNLVATAQANGRDLEAEQTVSEAFWLAGMCGLFLAMTVWTMGQPLLQLIAGQASANVVPSALKYAVVRAVGQPAVIVASVARASALAAQDTRGPLLSVAMAFALNALGTLFLVRVAKLGIIGAAIGTLMADTAAAAFLLLRIWRERRSGKKASSPADSSLDSISSDSEGGVGGGVMVVAGA